MNHLHWHQLNPLHWDATTWSAWAAVATWVAIVVGGGFALAQLRQARKVQVEQSRPYVTVDFEFRSLLVYLVINNIGTTVARDVRINFDPPLESSGGPSSEINESPVFRDGVPMIAPGRKIRVYFDQYNDRAGSENSLPMRYDVVVEYSDTSGNQYEDPPYPLDLGMYEGSELPPKDISDLVDEVEKLRKEVSKWTSGISGIEVHAVNKEKQRRREIRPVLVKRGTTILKQQGIPAFGRWYVDLQLRRHGWRR